MTKAKCLLFTAGMVLAMAFTISCGEEVVVNLRELQKRGDIYVASETQKPYSGKFVTTYRGNVIKEAGSLKKGKLHGETTTYREDGSIDMITTFADGVLNGKRGHYDESSKLRRIEYYKGGKEDGKREYYDENGKLRRIEYYKGGKEDGKREYYDENEKLIVAQQGSFTDSRDKKTYKTVKIGTQTWMAENLNYEADGSECYDNCQKYGRLYDWSTAMKACPSGWHLPSNAEWNKLVDIANGGGETAAGALKAKSGWKDDGNGMDQFGFSALPGGLGSPNGSFNYAGSLGYWWSASEDDSDDAYCRLMYYNRGSANWYNNYKSYLFSVRCLQD